MPFPQDRSFDSTLALVREGYTFTHNRFQRFHSDVFETRLMLRKAICTKGEDASVMFYHPDRFTRKQAMPPITLRLLQDKGSVELMSGESHRIRKQLFLSLMTPDRIRHIGELAADQWLRYIRKWEHMDHVVLHHEVEELLCRVACAWAGVPLPETEVVPRTQEFSAMIDGAGGFGLRKWRGLLLRARTERWIKDMFEQAREGKLKFSEGSAAHHIVLHQDVDGTPLNSTVAAVEMLNVLRPIVAVAYYVTFAALALRDHPESLQRIQAGDQEYLTCFVHEVRRHYPFFPLIGGRAQQTFDWRGHSITKGTWVLLDLYGTNHDARIWEEPEHFRPERFRQWKENAYSFIPQGGGDHAAGHRCPGEWITIELMKRAVHMLVTAMRYDIPEQDVQVDLTRMPAIPNSRFILHHVKGLL